MAQVVYFAAVLVSCQHPVLASPNWRDYDLSVLWRWPLIASLLVGVVAFMWFAFIPGWRLLFAFNLLGCLICPGIGMDDMARRRDMLLLHGAVPFWLSLIAIAMAVWTTKKGFPAGQSPRPIAHWTGLAVALLPLLCTVLYWCLIEFDSNVSGLKTTVRE